MSSGWRFPSERMLDTTPPWRNELGWNRMPQPSSLARVARRSRCPRCWIPGQGHEATRRTVWRLEPPRTTDSHEAPPRSVSSGPQLSCWCAQARRQVSLRHTRRHRPPPMRATPSVLRSHPTTMRSSRVTARDLESSRGCISPAASHAGASRWDTRLQESGPPGRECVPQ
jgi:hypothetical protein